ncbi:NADP-specific glutamate dehydrogenase [Facklamia miroungae]|uniref:Glutamate dehydrogenase n=1 Tax=Facklamia miroungae TaxID=120956 RepID=A0A1G7T899_9LACT|nr:NADP-specific glutamate dehydrogenase [Facklamia miroungae]NKZ29681.1 NADP-specific glutamate dehydrogenase [Facklamia miroungae]SDG30819.1 glutamate dehydrogenase (NADP+) [Facklamia miroungae]
MFHNPYVKKVYSNLQTKFAHQTEYLQAVKEFLSAIEFLIDQDKNMKKEAILERLVSPERIITFRVPWQDDQGQVNINWGYRVQHSSLLGPYKGGLRFDTSVNESILKFLAFEQTFKNVLIGLPMGGGKGGADFSPRGRSDQEIMRFCQSFMTELAKHINEKIDVPAGDIGVGQREIGYLYGQYKRVKGIELASLTGKPVLANGSLGREEATGYGLIYFLQAMLEEENEQISQKRLIISGLGNVGLNAIHKAVSLGGIVVAVSNSQGSLYDPQGINVELLENIINHHNKDLSFYSKMRPQASFSKVSIWSRSIQADIALPCATQNEISAHQAKNLIANGVRYLAEGANMPCNSEAIQIFNQTDNFIWAPGKAANAGGVAVSGLEMSQNAIRLQWSFDEVDQKLQSIMFTIFKTCQATCQEYNLGKQYAVAADVASFKKIVDLIRLHGLV